MDITTMTDDEFAEGFIKGLLRSGEMREDDIAAAFDKAREYQVGACLIGMLIEGKLDAKWNGKEFVWSTK